MSKLTQGQQAVLSAFDEFGPMTDVALAVYVHHIASNNMSSSGVRTRRSELTKSDPPLVQPVGFKKLKSGRRAAVHDLTIDGRKTLNDIK